MRVATRTNALWQIRKTLDKTPENCVATRTNALWQMARAKLLSMAAASRNPHECAVANRRQRRGNGTGIQSQPARMRCGKSASSWQVCVAQSSQPARMRCGKYVLNVCVCSVNPSQPARMRCGKLRYTDGADLSHSRNPHECAVANHSSSIFDSSISVATRTNALWQIF